MGARRIFFSGVGKLGGKTPYNISEAPLPMPAGANSNSMYDL